MGREDVSLTYTGIMKQGDKRVVKIRFTRNGEKDFAECILPGGTIEKSQGFSEKELASLRFYLKTNAIVRGLQGYIRLASFSAYCIKHADRIGWSIKIF